jgi:hypothetical protein
MRSLVGSILSAALACTWAHAADALPAAVGALFGAWKIDPVLTATPHDTAAPGGDAQPSGAGHQRGAGGRHGGGTGGGSGGMGGGGAGMGGGGGRHGGDRRAPAAGANRSAKGEEAERNERGLARLFAPQLTITPLAQRIRFDDGEHVVELDKDGMNLSGGGVGGTVALAATSPDLVVETLTDSGYSLQERYHLSDDGKHLQLHASLKQPGTDTAREIDRVFDHADVATTQKSTVHVETPAR